MALAAAAVGGSILIDEIAPEVEKIVGGLFSDIFGHVRKKATDAVKKVVLKHATRVVQYVGEGILGPRHFAAIQGNETQAQRLVRLGSRLPVVRRSARLAGRSAPSLSHTGLRLAGRPRKRLRRNLPLAPRVAPGRRVSTAVVKHLKRRQPIMAAVHLDRELKNIPKSLRLVRSRARKTRLLLKKGKRRPASDNRYRKRKRKKKMPYRKRRRTTPGRRAPRSGGSHTGGTGDIKPQILTLSAGPVSVDDYGVAAVALPQPRNISGGPNRSTVFEFLSVDWYLGVEDHSDQQAVDFGCLSTIAIHTANEACTLASFMADVANPRVIAPVIRCKSLLSVATNHAAAQVFHCPITVDLTDHNGNGLLVAVDQIHITGGNVTGTSNTQTVVCKLKYRITNVHIQEFVGIVQSQS